METIIVPIVMFIYLAWDNLNQRNKVKQLRTINSRQAEMIEDYQHQKESYDVYFKKVLGDNNSPESRFYAANQVIGLIKSLSYNDRVQLVHYETISRNALREMQAKVFGMLTATELAHIAVERFRKGGFIDKVDNITPFVQAQS